MAETWTKPMPKPGSCSSGQEREDPRMPFIEVKGKKADCDAVSITFERTVLEDLDRYTKFTNRDSRSRDGQRHTSEGVCDRRGVCCQQAGWTHGQEEGQGEWVGAHLGRWCRTWIG